MVNVTQGVMLDGQGHFVIKSVTTKRMVITAYTTVVVTVSIALHVTKRLVFVTEGVIRVILMVTVAKIVHLAFLELIALKHVANIV